MQEIHDKFWSICNFFLVGEAPNTSATTRRLRVCIVPQLFEKRKNACLYGINETKVCGHL